MIEWLENANEYNRIVVRHQSTSMSSTRLIFAVFISRSMFWQAGVFQSLIPRSLTKIIKSNSLKLFCVQLLLIHMEQRCIGLICIILRKHNSFPSEQNGCHFADDNFLCIFVNGNVCILFTISMEFAPIYPIDNTRALVQVMAWRHIGDNPLHESMPIQFTNA